MSAEGSYQLDFSTLTVGSGTPTGMTVLRDGGNLQIDVVAGSYFLQGKALRIRSELTQDWRAIGIDAIVANTNADFDIVWRARNLATDMTDSSKWAEGVFAQWSPSAGTSGRYIAGFGYRPSSVTMARSGEGANNWQYLSGGDAASAQRIPNNTHWFRFRREGNRYKLAVSQSASNLLLDTEGVPLIGWILDAEYTWNPIEATSPMGFCHWRAIEQNDSYYDFFSAAWGEDNFVELTPLETSIFSRVQSARVIATSAAPSFSANPIEHNLLIVTSFNRSGGTEASINGYNVPVGETTPDGWTKAHQEEAFIYSLSHRRASAIWFKIANGTEGLTPATVTWNLSTGSHVLIEEFTAATYFDWALLASSQSNSGFRDNLTSISTKATGAVFDADLLVWGFCAARSSGSSFTFISWDNLDNGLLSTGTSGTPMFHGFKQTTTGGTKEATATIADNFNGYNAAILVFGKPQFLQEKIYPENILTQTNLVGTITNLQNDPLNSNNTWLAQNNEGINTSLRVLMPRPNKKLINGEDLQILKYRLRRDISGVSGVQPDVAISLYDNGTLIRQLNSFVVHGLDFTEVVGMAQQVTFNASEIPNLPFLEVVIAQTSGGGSAHVEIESIEWLAAVEENLYFHFTKGTGLLNTEVDYNFRYLYDNFLGYEAIEIEGEDL